MLHLLYGPDDYSANAAATALVREHGADDFATRLDGQSVSWSSLREACFTMPLFATSHVLVLRGLLGAWTGRGDGGGKASGKPSPADFAAFVGTLPASTHLILLEGELTAANRYLKELTQLPPSVAAVRPFPALQGVASGHWIAARVREGGGTIAADAVAALVERGGGDTRRLANAIQALLTYTAPQRAIAVRDVETLVPAGDDATGFALVDAISSRQSARVVDLVDRLLAGGQAPEAILALLGVRIRDLTLLAAAGEEGIDSGTLQSRSGWTPGRFAHLQRARRDFSPAELRDAQAVLVSADTALKSRPTHERPTIVLLAILSIVQRRDASELAAALAY